MSKNKVTINGNGNEVTQSSYGNDSNIAKVEGDTNKVNQHQKESKLSDKPKSKTEWGKWNFLLNFFLAIKKLVVGIISLLG